MGNTELQKKHSDFFIYGWWAIALGVIFFAIFIVDYQKEFILKYKDLDNLGGIIGATTGICFSLAGLFFVLDNLQLQRETLLLQKKELENQIDEMRVSNEHFNSQNKSIINQQYQTTFFNILSSYGDMVANIKFGEEHGYSGISNYYVQLDSQIAIYNQDLSNKTFERYEATHLNPIYKLEDDKFAWDSYFENLVTLLEFIDSKLSDELYYKLVNNSLSISEKYVIGLYCENIENKYSRYFRQCKFDYSQFYKNHGNTYKLSEESYFPSVSIVWQNKKRVIRYKELRGEIPLFEFIIKIERNLLDIELAIESISIETFFDEDAPNLQANPARNHFFQTQIKSDDLSTNEFKGNLHIRISKEISTALMNPTIPRFKLQLTFNFKFKNLIYKVKKRYSLYVDAETIALNIPIEYHDTKENWRYHIEED